MGWWQDGDKVLGDGPLDSAEEFLRAVAAEYVEDQGRRPTLDELLTIISRVLGRGTAEFVDDGENIQVIGVMAETKRQSGKRSIAAGDVFAVPLGDGRIAFGRLTPQLSFVEFFDAVAEEGDQSEKWRSAPLVRFPFLIDVKPIEKGRWKIVGRVPYEGDPFVLQQFIVGGQVTRGEEPVDGFIDVSAQLRPWSASDKDLPKMSMANEAYLIEILRRRFGPKT